MCVLNLIQIVIQQKDINQVSPILIDLDFRYDDGTSK